MKSTPTLVGRRWSAASTRPLGEDAPLPVPSTGTWPDPETALPAAAAAKTVITVANFYTPAARRRAGSHAAMKASIAANIARMNTGFNKSGVNAQIRQVSAQQIKYKETRTGSLSKDLNRLAGQTDRFLKSVHSVRNKKNADLVALIVSQAFTNLCGGLAFIPVSGPPTASTGFSVIEFPLCMAGFIYAHELAHNMGALHDWFLTFSPSTFFYAHGYVDVKRKFRTIMASNARCSAVGITCVPIGLYSNPKKKFNGGKVGVGGSKQNCKAGKISPSGCAANNARGLNKVRTIVASNR